MSDAGFILNATNELYRIFDALNENYNPLRAGKPTVSTVRIM